MTDDEFPEFYGAYIRCALWSSVDVTGENDEPLDENYDGSDLTEGTKAAFEADCRRFIEENAHDLVGLDPGQCGHDFWLTRNGHGAGFWDRGLGLLGKRLTKASKAYGSVCLYVNDDGKIDY